MRAEIWIRPRTEVNTDPQRRCYNGCHAKSEIVYGEWHYFQSWDTVEFAELVAKGLRCERQEVEVREVL